MPFPDAPRSLALPAGSDENRAVNVPVKVSVIVPTLNEATVIGPTLRALRREDPHEIVVVDGGSEDGTLDEARPHADRMATERGGLARQLNRGAEEATGDVLLFNYADTIPAAGAIRALVETLAEGDVVGGAFKLGFDSGRRAFGIVAAGANLRNLIGFGPFGDQGIFVRRGAFFKAGAFRSAVFLEDLEFVRRVRRLGRFRILGLRVRTSVRRWDEQGMLRTLFCHWLMSVVYLCGKRKKGGWPDRWRRNLLSRRGGKSAEAQGRGGARA